MTHHRRFSANSHQPGSQPPVILLTGQQGLNWSSERWISHSQDRPAFLLWVLCCFQPSMASGFSALDETTMIGLIAAPDRRIKTQGPLSPSWIRRSTAEAFGPSIERGQRLMPSAVSSPWWSKASVHSRATKPSIARRPFRSSAFAIRSRRICTPASSCQ